MHRRKAILILVILLGASAFWGPRQIQLLQARQTLAKTNAQRTATEERIAGAAAALERMQRQLDAENARRVQAQTALAKAENNSAKANPDSYWSQPPQSLPDWQSASPYFWLRKELLPQLPLPNFTKNGALDDRVAFVLTLDRAQKGQLNSALTKILADYHALELAKADRSNEHLSGIGSEPGPKITIRINPLPEEGAKARQAFEAALHDTLGEQRANLLIQAADSWFDSQFSHEGSEPKTITVVRHRDKTYGIATRFGGSWMSTSGQKSIDNYVPPHLLPLFQDLLKTNPQNEN